jgi:hypothetical protein
VPITTFSGHCLVPVSLFRPLIGGSPFENPALRVGLWIPIRIALFEHEFKDIGLCRSIVGDFSSNWTKPRVRLCQSPHAV